MPIREFRGVEGMDDRLWHEQGGPALWLAIASVWELASRTCPRRFPPGVYKHRCVEEAKALRDGWEDTDFRALWAKRCGAPEECSRVCPT